MRTQTHANFQTSWVNPFAIAIILAFVIRRIKGMADAINSNDKSKARRTILSTD